MTLARLTQVSFWGPETLRGNGASARAKHQQATAEKVSAVTTERNNMLKTLKRKIALGAVAAVGAAGLVTIAAPAANATAPNAASLTVTAIARAGVDVNIKVVGLTSAGAAAANDEINAVVLSTTPAGAAVPVFNTDATYTSGVAYLSANSATETYTAAAGTVYQILVWADPFNTNSNTSAPLADSVTKIFTVTVGGTPSVASLVLPTTLQLSATGNGTTTATPNVAVAATLKDASGVATILKTNESLVAKITGATTVETVVAYGSVTTAQTAAAGTASATMTVATTDMGTYTAGVGDTATATATIAVSGGGLLTGLLTGATGTIQVGAAVDATAVSVTGTSALSGTLTAGKYTALAADPTAVTVPTTTTSLTFTATVADANFGKYVDFVVTSTTAGLVTAGHNLVATDATTGKASFTVTTLVAPAATNTYTVVVKNSVTTTVTYQASTFGTASKGVVTQSPTATTLTVKAGATLPLKVTVTDQFGAPLQNAVVNFANAGARNTANVNILTDATGVATYSYTDKGTTASTSADTIAINATYGGNSIAGSSYTVNYVATDPTATTVTFSGAVAATQSVAVTTSTATAPKLGIERAMTLTAGALTSTGATLPGVPVTWAASGGGVFGSTSSTYTDPSGNATGTVYWTKTGTQTVTVTIGGKSATLTVAVVNSKALATGDNVAGSGLVSGAYTGDERIISLSPATTSLTSGNFAPITATVKDRYGNPVAGVTVTFTKVGSGRFGNGAASVTGVTLTDGTASIDYGSGTTESGDSTITATFATGDGNQTTPTALLADGTTAAPAAVISATAKVSIKAAAVASDAATAAAQKATDAKIADIATAVTNLSTTVAGLVASLVAQIKDTKAAITDTQAALAALAAVVKRIQVKVKA